MGILDWEIYLRKRIQLNDIEVVNNAIKALWDASLGGMDYEVAAFHILEGLGMLTSNEWNTGKLNVSDI
jgi:hypothetical protein